MSVLRILLKRNKPWIAAAIFTALLSNLSQMIYMYYVGELVNKIETRAAIGRAFIILLAGFIVSNAITQILNQYVGRYSAERMAHTLRMGYARRLIHKTGGTGGDSAEQSESSAGRKGLDTATAMSVVQNELAQADGYLSGAFFDVTGMLITGILATVFLMFQNVYLTFVILIPTLIILVYVIFSSRKLSGIVTAAQQEKSRMNKTAYSVVHAFPAVKTFDGEALCKEAYDSSVKAWTKQQAKLGRRSALYNSLSGILSRVPLLLLLLAGGYMVVSGKILMGTLIVFLNLQKSLTQSIMNLPSWLSGFKVFTTNLSRIEIE